MIDPPLDGNRRTHKSWGEYLFPYKATGDFRVEIAEGAEMIRFDKDHRDSVVSKCNATKLGAKGQRPSEFIIVESMTLAGEGHHWSNY